MSSTGGIGGGQAIQLISKLTTALILFVGAKLAMNGKMTVGELADVGKPAESMNRYRDEVARSNLHGYVAGGAEAAKAA